MCPEALLPRQPHYLKTQGVIKLCVLPATAGVKNSIQRHKNAGLHTPRMNLKVPQERMKEKGGRVASGQKQLEGRVRRLLFHCTFSCWSIVPHAPNNMFSNTRSVFFELSSK